MNKLTWTEVDTSTEDTQAVAVDATYMDADDVASMMLQGFTAALDVVMKCRGQLQMQGNAFGLQYMRRVSEHLEGVQAQFAAARFAEEVR